VAAWKTRTLGNKPLLYQYARLFFAVTAGAWLVMALCWPWIQAAPFTRPFHALRHFARFPWPGSVLFDGHVIKAMDVPRTYTLHWFAITLPEIVLLLVCIAGPIALWRAGRNLRRHEPSQVIGVALVMMSVLVPVAYGLIARPVLYDAERHSLYVVPPLICLAALAWAWTSARLAALSPTAARAATAAVLIATAANAYVMIRLHPYEYVFFNRAAGGLPGAAGRYETDYWLSSYREAVQLLRRHIPDDGRTYKIYMSSTEREAASYYFPKNIELASSPQEADFFLASTRYRFDESIQAPVVARVQRFGVPLAVIKDLGHRQASTKSQGDANESGFPLPQRR